MVLDVDRHPPRRGVEGRPLRHGPRHEDAIDLEPEVVVQAGRAMALDDEPAGSRVAPAHRPAGGLGGLPEVAFALVFVERHRPQVCRVTADPVPSSLSGT